MEIVTLGFLNIVVFAAKGLAVTIPTPSDHFYVPVTYDKERLVNSLQAAPLSELIKLESTSFHRVTTNKGDNVIFYHSKEIKEKLTSPRKSRSTDSQLPKEQTIEENRKSQVCSLELTVDPFVWSFALRKHCQNEKNAMEDVHAMLRDHVSVLNPVFKDVRFPPYTNTQTKQDYVRIQFEIHSIAIYNDSWCGLTSSSICNSSLEYEQVLRSYSDTVIYKRLTENSKATINYPDFENADANDSFLSDDYFNNRLGQYCLSVLFTARELYKTTDEGKIPVNGLSMTAELGNSNGVCKEHNFAFVNLYKDAENPYMPSTLTHLVLAHELAHSLGALHDTGGIECIPEKDGFYLMHNVTVDGKDLNNYRLSPCSVDSIAKILSDPNRTSCFKDRSLSVCGNGLVEVGEECDCGTVCYLDDGCHSSQEENRCLLKYNTDNSNSSVLGVGSIDKTANDTACITEGRDGLCTERLNPWTNGQNTNWLLLVLMSTLCCTVLFSVVALLVWKCRPSVCFHCSSAVKSRHCARVFNASENTTDNLQLPALPNGLSKIPTEDSKTHLLAFYKTGDTVIECAPETFQKV